MMQRQERKNFLGLKEMREAHRQWLNDFGWAQEYAWHDQPHASCSCTPGGKWRLQSFGYYLASDWNHRLYQSHRCSKCGMMVQHNQLCNQEGRPEGLITRLVIIP
jgi:hypothetical protein